MEDTANFFINLALTHWPFVSAFVCFTLIGQVMINNVFTEKSHYTSRPVWLFWWGHKTLALHPMFAGMLLGLVWHNPVETIHTTAGSMGYFALAGAASIMGYEALKGLAKKKGVNIDLPGIDD